MKKIKKFILIGLSVCTAFAFTACNKVKKHEHQWDGGSIVREASCTQEGEKVYKCKVKNCVENYSEKISKTEHSYDSGTVTKQPTCSEEGIKTYICKYCTNSYTEGIEKITHTYDNGTLTTIPTITSGGVLTYTCGICKTTKTETVVSRANFKESFTTSTDTQSAWKYGYAQNVDLSSGAFIFVEFENVDGEQPNTYKGEGVSISKDKISSSANCVIGFTIDRECNSISYQVLQALRKQLY